MWLILPELVWIWWWLENEGLSVELQDAVDFVQ